VDGDGLDGGRHGGLCMWVVAVEWGWKRVGWGLRVVVG
jgi:hypothetical protein